jgi:hypothetical protein
VQVWKNLELAPSHERNNLLQPKFIDPHAISHEIPHLVIEHGQGDRRILKKNIGVVLGAPLP